SRATSVPATSHRSNQRPVNLDVGYGRPSAGSRVVLSGPPRNRISEATGRLVRRLDGLEEGAAAAPGGEHPHDRACAFYCHEPVTHGMGQCEFAEVPPGESVARGVYDCVVGLTGRTQTDLDMGGVGQ